MSGSRKTKPEARDRQFNSELGRSGISGPDFIHLSILPLIRIRLLFFSLFRSSFQETDYLSWKVSN